jgi:hypothetical protein
MSNIEDAISLLTRISEIANNKNQGIGAPAEVGLAQEAIRLLEAAKVPTLQQHFAAFNMRWEASFHMSDSGFESGTRSFYGKRIGIIDTPNDTTHEVSIESVEALESWDQETLDEAVADGNIESWKLNVVFQDLVNKGVLQPAKYYVRVCW